MSPALSNVLMRALDRNQAQRFASCAELADALEAAATGKERVATPRELAAYVDEVLGDDVSAQREAVRAWIARSEPSQVGLRPGTPASSVSAAAMSLSELAPMPLSQRPSEITPIQPRSSAVRVVLVLLLLLAVGGGSFLFARKVVPERQAAAVAPVPVPPPSPLQPAAPLPSPEPGPSVSSAASLGVPPAPPKVVLPQHARAIAKPPDTDLATKKPKKKPADDVDLRNPYR